jgi:hypothetical protein
MSSFFERLISCKQPEESDAAFCRRLDLNWSVFRRWRQGQQPTLQTVARIASKTEKSPSWLLFGVNSQHSEEALR